MEFETVNVKKAIRAETETEFLSIISGALALGLSYDVKMRWAGGDPRWIITIYIPEAESDTE